MEDIYEEEMHKTLQRKELALPKPVNGSLQCKYRSVLVSWIQDVSRFFELTMTSCHLAVALMDYFMEDDTVPTDHPFLVAICCVQIGAKFEEREVRIPRPKDLVACTNHFYTNSECMAMELAILKYFNWEIGLPTVAHFSTYYETVLVDSIDIVSATFLGETSVGKARQLCGHYLLFFNNHVLEDVRYRHFRPSVLAGAIMAAIRIKVGLGPIWPSRLEHLTGHSMGAINDSLKCLLTGYETHMVHQKEMDLKKCAEYSSSKLADPVSKVTDPVSKVTDPVSCTSNAESSPSGHTSTSSSDNNSSSSDDSCVSCSTSDDSDEYSTCADSDDSCLSCVIDINKA